MQKGFALPFVLVSVLVLISLGGYWVYQNNFQNIRKINSFEDCAKHYPVLNSYPAQCNTPDGRHFVQQLSEQEKEKLKSPKQSQEDLLRKCGDITRDDFDLKYGHYSAINGPEWSPDCQYSALSIWQSGTSYIEPPDLTNNYPPPRPYPSPQASFESSEAGIYLRNSQTKKTTRIYSAKDSESVAIFKGWSSEKEILFEEGEGQLFIVNINSFGVNPAQSK